MIEVLGIDHIDLCITDLARSTQFYERILGTLGFSRVAHPNYTAWSNGIMNIGLRAAPSPQGSIRSAGAGLHHLALRARARQQVDELYRFLLDARVDILDPPAEYPQYGSHYYAVFFSDPDGLKLELVHFPWGYWRTVQTEGRDERPRYVPKESL